MPERQAPADSRYQQQAISGSAEPRREGSSSGDVPDEPDDYREMGAIWNGPHSENGSQLRVVDGPPEGSPVPLHPAEPQLTSPIGPDGVDTGLLGEIAVRLFGNN
jgi:hypothetical protein